MAKLYLAFVGCAIITALRDLDALTKPILWAEDSVAVFAHYYNVTGIPPPRYWGGYLSVGVDLIGYVVSYFPTRWQPHMLAGIAIAISSASFALFAAPMFRKIVANDNQRFVIAVALAAIPLGNFAKVGLIGYTQWPVGIILVLIVSAAPNLSLRSRNGAGLFLLTLVLLWTNPSLILALPVFAYEGWRTRSSAPSSALGNLLLAMACVLYVTLGRTYAPVELNVLEAVIDGTRLLLERAVFESAFGTMARMWMLTNIHWAWMDAIAVAELAAVAFALRHRARDPEFGAFLFKAVYLSVTICYLSALMRDRVGLNGAFGRRYAFIPSAVFTIFALIAITDALVTAAAVRRVAAIATIVVGIGVMNSYNNWLYHTPSQHWPRFRAFINSVVAAEKEGRAVTITLEGEEREGWPIIVHVRPR